MSSLRSISRQAWLLLVFLAIAVSAHAQDENLEYTEKLRRQFSVPAKDIEATLTIGLAGACSMRSQFPPTFSNSASGFTVKANRKRSMSAGVGATTTKIPPPFPFTTFAPGDPHKQSETISPIPTKNEAVLAAISLGSSKKAPASRSKAAISRMMRAFIISSSDSPSSSV
ncbi:MAG: hypothetical protein AAF514_14685 [Verrucomicrobiota bacterium]